MSGANEVNSIRTAALAVQEGKRRPHVNENGRANSENDGVVTTDKAVLPIIIRPNNR